MPSQLYPATLACVLLFDESATQTYTQAGKSTVHVFSSHPSTGGKLYLNVNYESKMHSLHNHFCG